MEICLNKFSDKLILDGKSEKTILDYCYNVKLFIKFCEESTGKKFSIPFLEIQVRDYMLYMSNVEKKSVSTINTRLAAIQQFANFCSSEYKAPAMRVQRKKNVQAMEVDILTPIEFKNLKYQIYYGNRGTPNLLHIAIFELLYYSGIREAELCNLELQDVIITERKQYIKIRNGKGEKYREIRLHPNARKALLNYLKVRPETDSDNFFIGRRGTFTPNAVYKMIKRYGVKAGIKKNVYPHMLRHQCFTEQAKYVTTAQDLKNLSSNAGHESVITTMKYYIANNREGMDKLIDKMN